MLDQFLALLSPSDKPQFSAEETMQLRSIKTLLVCVLKCKLFFCASNDHF